jgi:pantetheine-phosphate adenylyltransferase
MRLAVYPGSFDPITRGHIDVIERASVLFDRLLVAVLVNTRKSPSMAAAERVQIIREAIDEELPAATAAAVEVAAFEGLTVDLARERGAMSIVRGLRALSDFENELAIAHLNRKLAPQIDTVFFMTGIEHAYLSSGLVREIAAFGGDISAMVPDAVARRLAVQGGPPGAGES